MDSISDDPIAFLYTTFFTSTESDYDTSTGYSTSEDFHLYRPTLVPEVLPEQNQTTAMNNQLKTYDILIPLMGSLIIGLNLAVVVSSWILLKKGQQPKCTYLLLGNVAMADLVTGVAVIYGQSFSKGTRTHTVCTIHMGLILSSTIASIYSVGLIAADRFLYILHGLKYRRWVYPQRVKISIGVTWVLGLIIGFLPAMGWYGYTDNGRICWFIMLAPPKLIVLTVVVGISPVILVCVLYSIILYNAIKKVIQMRKMGKENSVADESNPNKMRVFRGGMAKASVATVEDISHELNNANDGGDTKSVKSDKTRIQRLFQRLREQKSDKKTSTEQNKDKKPSNPSKWKAIKVVIFTTGSFVLTWVPYFIACIWYISCDFEATPGRCHRLKFAIASPLAILGFMNSLLNPVIYAWWHNGFRNSIMKICCRKIKKNPQVTGQGRVKQEGSKSSQTITASETFTPTSTTSDTVVQVCEKNI